MLHKVRWTTQKIGQRIEMVESLVYRRQAPIGNFRYRVLPGPMSAPPIDADVNDREWTVVAPYTHWAKKRTDFVLRGTFTVPTEWETDRAVALYLPLGEAGDFSHPEALAYIDSVPYAACDRHHQEILLAGIWCDGQEHQLALHGWTGGSHEYAHHDPEELYIRQCEVVQIDQPTRDFVATARVALGIAENLDEDNPTKGRLLNSLDGAFKLLDLRDPIGDAFYASIPDAHAALKTEIAGAGPAMDVSIVATGHAHIDVAWLWTLGQTRRKSGRTFHTVLRLMEQFPDYHFTQSQPQLYDYVRQDYPELFESIKSRVEEGRWETIGGMWVEADCNLSGSESLARQFLLGRTFFRQHFGPDTESPVLWLPDVFGYAWNLPQLIKEAGLEYFFTIKIGWSQYNRLPYDSFWWQGLDGTRVLTHFSTTPDYGSYASTYNAMASPKQTLGTWTNFQQKELQHELLMAFGYGDGGGGPTREMLENIREMGDFPAAPRMRQRPVGEFFSDLEKNSGDRLPIWNGELYLELHRGTYTTQSRNKRANRKSEFLLHDAEFAATLATLVATDYTYPHDSLHRAWELVCLNQFHDIIPGSSINPVYVESQEQYAEVRALGESVVQEALAAIVAQTHADIIVVNPTGFAQRGLAFWSGHVPSGRHVQRTNGVQVAAQGVQEGTWLDVGQLDPLSVTALILADGDSSAPSDSLSISPNLLENTNLRVELNDEGDITRIYDKGNDREVLPPDGIANQFLAFEDRPLRWDAWDVDIFYDDKVFTSDPAQSVTVVEQGPLRATLEIRRRILHSEYVQRISLAHNSAQLDFDTTIDWRERHILLKVAFPLDVLSPTATYEIQWGNVERPTHRNTSWDWARFETCAQKWVDLSEGGYGASLLNDCKYGHDIHENIMRISLLRGPTHPDPEADLGEHRFAYSLLPHAGRWSAQTIAAAYALNDPPLVVSSERRQTGGSMPAGSLIAIDAANIVIETVKLAENGDGVIVRFYECQRRRGQIKLSTGFSLSAAWRSNLLEENQNKLAFSERQVTMNVKPYEIVTVRLVPR